MIAEVLRQKLAADSTVTGDLATYDFATGSAEAPAIFTTPLPEDVKVPAIYISPGTAVDFACRKKRGAEVTCDVDVFDDNLQNHTRLARLAQNVWDCLDRAALESLLDAEGYDFYGCWATMPRDITSPGAFPTRLVECTVRVLKQEERQ